jgi:hypothetical protein
MDDDTVQLKYSLQGGAADQTGPEGIQFLRMQGYQPAVIYR